MKKVYWIVSCLLLVVMTQAGCQDVTGGFLDIPAMLLMPRIL